MSYAPLSGRPCSSSIVLGELPKLWAVATEVFLGGFAPIGWHIVLDPAAHCKATVCGDKLSRTEQGFPASHRCDSPLCVSSIYHPWYNNFDLGEYLHGQRARIIMEKSYVEQRDGGYWVTGTRISLDSIVYAFKRGMAPESIQRAFPLLILEEVYGAITFYLAHEQEIEAYLAQAEAELKIQARALNAAAQTANPTLFQCLEHARHARETTHQ